MHELGIAEAALRAALEETRVAAATKLARIVLRVGEFLGVDAEALRFAFAAIQPGNAAEGTALEIESVAAVAGCSDCQCDFRRALRSVGLHELRHFDLPPHDGLLAVGQALGALWGLTSVKCAATTK